ncbi:MAG: AmmeMemoRadiSam system protein A [Acidobacteria bacterium]|mgnify:CR=1 FL=1|nr:AmmeMemoRadiSam system protein A [Acidobacteriota bacterium]
MLSPRERRLLLQYARDTLAAYFQGEPPPPRPSLENPTRHSGAFVTLAVGGDLRGCIGYPGSSQPLDRVVAECAVAAASEDPRFTPLRRREMDALEIEISVLTPIVPVEDLNDIVVGRDGLVVSDGRRRGLLLPQVAVEHGWDRDTFLAHTCLKAGLRADAWKTGARVLRFQAEVFSERGEHATASGQEPGGEASGRPPGS